MGFPFFTAAIVGVLTYGIWWFGQPSEETPKPPIFKRKRGDSVGILNCKKFLDSLKIHYKKEIRLPAIKINRRFDLFFEFHGRKYIIEFDGEQHFRFTFFYHRHVSELGKSQMRDRCKTYIALRSDINVIRIHRKEYPNIQKFLIYVLSIKPPRSRLFVDDVRKYQYLLDNPVEVDESVKCAPGLTENMPGNVKLSYYLLN